MPQVPYTFPRWANYLLPVLAIAAIGGGLYLPVVLALATSPETIAVGYAPEQPVAFSHATHAGKLGMDCTYCHNTVSDAAFAAIPPTQTCLNCHERLLPDHPEILKVRQSALTGEPIEWVKVHNLPDHAHFNHGAHIDKGVGCVSCHGRVDQMEVVSQVEELSMSWCLDCHRQPEKHLRPLDRVTDMDWQPPDGDAVRLGEELKQQYGIRDPQYMTSCSRCHW